MSFNEAVKDVLNKFEEATRDYVDEDDCKGKYYRVKREFQDDENLRNMIYECHDEEIPNGWSYRTIINILEHLTSWDITTWDDGGVLTSIGNNQYAVIWVWANVANKEIALTFPQATYVSSANAEAEEIPSTFPATWYKGEL